ncbi:MAG TPA: TonB-dependent receptor [Thermoanaerobaculia bacterium]|nr:TonB-dependent receptor [Thermoanaerobaculia bacterium]
MFLLLASGRRAAPAVLAAAASVAALLVPLSARSQPVGAEGENPPVTLPKVSESVQVTATRVPEDVEPVPASITVVTGEELAARGATDLGTALATVAGVAIAPGGDAGPASSVPELWGLREFDAFLLVVDGVPWGGAFNPALSTLDLTGVERIEVLRGSAPVMYGATSFVGIIHIIHREAGAAGATARAWGGSYGTGGAAVATALPALGEFKQSLTVNGEKQGLSQARSGWERGHLLYRGALATGSGSFHLDLDGVVINQKPGSPTPRTGTFLTPLVPVDSNQNPLHSKIDDNRLQLNLGYDQKVGSGTWSTMLSGTHTRRTVGRGFLENVTGDNPDDHGIRQRLALDDLYFDSHLAFTFGSSVRLVAGVDELYGKAHNASGDWDFFMNVNGSNPPDINRFSPFGTTDLHDRRSFSGLYAQTEWTPTHRWRFQVGARLNHTHETLETTSVSLLSALVNGQVKDVTVGPGNDRRTVTRGSGAAGVSYLAWEGAQDAVWVYGDYRDTFKPAALDFGPDVNGVILKPETATSYEAGVKGRQLGGRFDWELSLFQMEFSNLVVAQLDLATGLPHLVNAGKERFKGVELEGDYNFAHGLRVQAAYSYHDAKYRNYLRVFDLAVGPEQLAGNRLPLSARDLGALGLIYAPATGFTAWAAVSLTGSRFLDHQNTAQVPSYDSWSAGVGYRFPALELRLDGWNLNDTRPAIAASEFGGDQFYRLLGRSFRLSAAYRF